MRRERRERGERGRGRRWRSCRNRKLPGTATRSVLINVKRNDNLFLHNAVTSLH